MTADRIVILSNTYSVPRKKIFSAFTDYCTYCQLSGFWIWNWSRSSSYSCSSSKPKAPSCQIWSEWARLFFKLICINWRNHWYDSNFQDGAAYAAASARWLQLLIHNTFILVKICTLTFSHCLILFDDDVFNMLLLIAVLQELSWDCLTPPLYITYSLVLPPA